MSLQPCPACGTRISDDADRCPFCRKNDPFKRKTRYSIVKIVVGLLIVGSAAWYFLYVALPQFKRGFLP